MHNYSFCYSSATVLLLFLLLQTVSEEEMGQKIVDMNLWDKEQCYSLFNNK